MMRTWARLKQHWVRHLLAALQVAVGVAVVIAVFVDVVPVIRASRPNRAEVVFSAFYGGRTDDGSTYMTSAFGIDDVQMLEQEFETVAAASVYSGFPSTLVQVDGDRFLLRGIAQVSPGFAAIVDMNMAAGRFFLPHDVEKDAPDVAVISDELAELLFPGEDPIGKIINLRPQSEEMRLFGYGNVDLPSTEGVPGLDLMVIGVFEQPNNLSNYEGPLVNTLRAEVYVPATGSSLYGHPAFRTSVGIGDLDEPMGFVEPPMFEETFTYLYFRAHDGMGEQAIAEVTTLLGARLAERLGGEIHVDDMPQTLVIDPARRMDPWLLQQRLQEVLVLGAFGAAAFIVAGFSVFTTFLAGVAERMRSIGLTQALGATRWRTLREIMSEAVMLSGFGGIIGTALAYPVRMYLLEPLEEIWIPTQAPTWGDAAIVVAAAIFVAMVIGALAALYPGWTVARLMPAEALTEE